MVYFVSCVNRTLAEGRDGAASVAEHTLSLFAKAGFAARYPDNLDALCCGQPFDSKTPPTPPSWPAARPPKALLAASDNGRIPVYIDNGPAPSG